MSATTRRAVSFLIGTLALAGFLVCLLMLTGCTPMVPSPRDPSVKVPAEQAMTEAETIAKAKQAEKRKAESRFKLAARKLQSTTEIDLAELTAAYDEVVEKADEEAAAIIASTQAAIKAAEDKQAAWVGGLSTVATIATGTGIPGVALAGGLLTGVLGMFSAAANKRKAKTAEEVAAAKEADAKAKEEIAVRLSDSIDWLKDVSPEVAAAFKTHAAKLAKWQGADAVNFVNRTQNS